MSWRWANLLLGLTTVVSWAAFGNAVGLPADSEPEVLPEHGLWEIAWDDSVDGLLDSRPKCARVKLAVSDGKVKGRFSGKVLNQTRRAIFEGEIIPSTTTPVLILRQLEEGYTCVYQLQLLQGILRGVWCDTQGRHGDVVLRRVRCAWF